MEKETNTEDADLSQNNGGDQQSGQDENNGSQDQQDGGQQQDAEQQDKSQEDYRGKLNATHRFLQKEGYEFKDGNWVKKAASSPVASAPAPVASAPAAPATQPALSRDEAILYSRGFTDAQVEQAKKVATLQNLKLTDAINDPLFTTWKAIEDKKEKDAQAQLPPSRGARATMKKTFGTKGLSDDDHKELFKEKVGQ